MAGLDNPEGHADVGAMFFNCKNRLSPLIAEPCAWFRKDVTPRCDRLGDPGVKPYLGLSCRIIDRTGRQPIGRCHFHEQMQAIRQSITTNAIRGLAITQTCNHWRHEGFECRETSGVKFRPAISMNGERPDTEAYHSPPVACTRRNGGQPGTVQTDLNHAPPPDRRRSHPDWSAPHPACRRQSFCRNPSRRPDPRDP